MDVVGPVAEGRLREARAVPAGVAADEGERLHQRQGLIGWVQVGQEVGHGDEDRETRAPALVPVLRPEVERGPHHTIGPFGLEEPQRGLGQHQRDALLQAVLQAASQPADRVGVRSGGDEHVAVGEAHVERDGVVGPRVEGAAAGQIEAGVMPVTGDEPGLDRALAEGEAEVGAAVLDGVRHAVVQDDEDGERPDLRDEATVALEIVERAGPDRIVSSHVQSVLRRTK